MAIGFGVVLAVAAFVPFVAISYRRRGRLTVGRSLLWAAALVYFCAIWTYTLFPLPDPDDLICVGKNTDVWQAVRDVQGARDRGHPFTDPAGLQLALNVLLFIPLGAFVRILGGRGLPTALVTGAAVSVFIETTQLTGMWGVYECAYRLFDVDDMVTNTAGAVLGSVLSLAVPRRLRGLEKLPGRDLAQPVTKTRRLIGVGCDVLAAAMLSALVAVGTQVWLEYVSDDRAAVLSGGLASVLGAAVPAGVWFLVIVATGRSVGDLCVELVYRSERLPGALVRPLRFAGGVGMYFVLTLLPDPYDAASMVFAAVAIVAVLFSRRGRGLPGWLASAEPVDSREAPAAEREPEVSAPPDQRTG
nr:VanZ family protein [Gordonia humi]